MYMGAAHRRRTQALAWALVIEMISKCKCHHESLPEPDLLTAPLQVTNTSALGTWQQSNSPARPQGARSVGALASYLSPPSTQRCRHVDFDLQEGLGLIITTGEFLNTTQRKHRPHNREVEADSAAEQSSSLGLPQALRR